ncbi:DNA polymerase II [Candidatus Woesearchaeota archaeon]|nr:DNA polymerase II [Candidatus Woesearchaeota archaeon]
MKGFIVDRTYRLIDSRAYVYLFGRLHNGASFLTINSFNPFFYIKKADLDKAKKIAPVEDEAVDMKSMDEEPVHKIILKVPRDVPTVRKAYEDQGIACFEADIRFTQRFCMNQGIYATLDIHGEYKKGQYVDRIYEEPDFTPVDYTPKLTTLSFDIETSLDGKHLYAISLVTHEKKKVLFLKEKENKSHQTLKIPNTELFDDEKSLLERFTALIKEWDPDVITGWNVIDFDLADLKRRFDKHKLPFKLGRADWDCALRLEKTFMKDSTADFPGRVVLDGIHLLRSSFVRLDDYKLETAARELLGEGKLIKGDDRHEEIERQYHNDPKQLIAYNLKDSELVLQILDKLQLIELTALRSMLTGLTMERVRASIASFDSVYIRHMNTTGIVAPSGTYTEKAERITGGYVMQSKPGIYDYILVLDFKSMYPSVIRSFNIDPVSYLPKAKDKKSTKDVIVAPNGACFKNDEGLLPEIIQHLWKQRDEAKKRKDQVASLAIKTLMNSFFGVLASANCRFFSLEMGNAITHFAQHFIKLAAEKIEGQGYEVIYGDTDSVFVKSGAKDVKEAEKIGTTIQDKINAFYEDYVQKEFYRTNFMELEAEKVYRKFMMPTLRGSDVGAKKRYAGLLMKDGKEKLDFTGLEFVRRDWTEVSKKFQLELLDKIFHEQEVTGYVKTFIEDLKKGKYDKLLVYKKSVRKSLAEYVKTTPPHVKAARILEHHLGGLPSSIIEYIMTENGPEPVDYLTGTIDYDHYIAKQIKPLADSVLGFYGTTFDELIEGSQQQTLFGY